MTLAANITKLRNALRREWKECMRSDARCGPVYSASTSRGGERLVVRVLDRKDLLPQHAAPLLLPSLHRILSQIDQPNHGGRCSLLVVTPTHAAARLIGRSLRRLIEPFSYIRSNMYSSCESIVQVHVDTAERAASLCIRASPSVWTVLYDTHELLNDESQCRAVLRVASQTKVSLVLTAQALGRSALARLWPSISRPIIKHLDLFDRRTVTKHKEEVKLVRADEIGAALDECIKCETCAPNNGPVRVLVTVSGEYRSDAIAAAARWSRVLLPHCEGPVYDLISSSNFFEYLSIMRRFSARGGLLFIHDLGDSNTLRLDANIIIHLGRPSPTGLFIRSKRFASRARVLAPLHSSPSSSSKISSMGAPLRDPLY